MLLSKKALERLEGLQRSIMKLLQPYVDKQFEAAEALIVAKGVEAVFDYEYPLKNIAGTLLQNLRPALPLAWAKIMSRQIAARKNELEHSPIILFERITSMEWLPVEVVGTEDAAWKDDQAGVILKFYIIAGKPAGHTLARKFPLRWLPFLAYKIGFSRKRQFEYQANEMVGLHVNVKTSVDKITGDVTFDDWSVDAAQLKYNREIISKRMRFDIPPNRDDEDVCPLESPDACIDCPCTYTKCNASYLRVR